MTDLGYFIPNEFSDPDRVLDQLCDPRFVAKTLWGEDGMAKAILCFMNYWGSCWQGFFLIAADFRASNARALKRYVGEMMEYMNATRMQTDSPDCEVLNRWHEWLGFTLEGTRRKMLFNRDYNMWALLREGE